MKIRTWLAVTAMVCGCGDDVPAADGDTSSGGSTTAPSTTAAAASTDGSTDGPDATSDGSTSDDTTSTGSGGTDADESGSSSSSGGVAENIVVHTAAPQQPVLASAADGSVIEWVLSDADGEAVLASDGVAMISSVNASQWTTIVGVEPGDTLWMQWRPFPDDTVLGTLEVLMPDLDAHPTPDDTGFSQLSIGCGETFVGGPAATESFTLEIQPPCVTDSGQLNLIAYAQGGPSIAVVGTTSLLGIEWEEGETTTVTLENWDGTLDDVLFTTEDPITQPVFNTTHTQWIEGVEFPMPRRSSSEGTRLFAADAPVDWLKHTGSTDLGAGPSRMAYAQRRAFDGADYELLTTSQLTPEISGASATQEDGRWVLTISAPESLDDLDGILLQTRWLSGFWAVMRPGEQTSVTLPELPDDLANLGPSAADTLDAPFAVAANTDAHEDYADFRPRGSWFFSGPDIVPDVDESLVRGTVFFPVPF